MEIDRRSAKVMDELKEFLAQREKEGLLRKLTVVTERQNGKLNIAGREYIDFSSNDYLGLSSHPKIIQKTKEALEKFGASCSAARLMSGNLVLYQQLEEEMARFKNKEAVLVFNSGYQANVGIISSLYGSADCIFSDRLNHASIIDGILLSGAKLFRFQHNDTTHLLSLLTKERKKYKKALIVTETVFSMEGDKSPLKELVEFKNKFDCQIMVDEAHATGLFGAAGSGVVEEAGLSAKIDFIMGTFGKALGGFGAYLASSAEVRDYLINTARSFIYSTALPPAVIAGNLASLNLVKEEPFRRKKVLALAKTFRQQLQELGFAARGCSQIVPVIIGDNFKALQLADKLKACGYWVTAVRPPTVPPKEARLRFSITYEHNQEILGNVIEYLDKNRV